MNICLVSSPRFNCKPTGKSLPPLGLAMLGAVAREGGHTVHGVEGVFLGRPRDIAARVAETDPDLVGLNTVTQDRLAGIATLQAIRAACPDALIVVGGAHFTCSADDALNTIPAIDVIVAGEGEQTFADLLQAGPDRSAWGDIAGLVYRDSDGRIVHTPDRPPIEDINTLPMPAWDLFDPSAYDRKASQLAKAAPAPTTVAGVMTSRGCPQRCVFCANARPTRVRYLSPAAAVDQMQWLRDTRGVNHLDMLDDNFLFSHDHAAAVCEEMLARNLNMTWWCGARAKGLDVDLLKLMKRAGCKSMAFGVETGTDTVLKAIRKNVTVADMLEAFTVVAEADIEQVGVCLIVGLPGETTDTIDQTVAFLRQLHEIVGDAWERESLIGQLPLIYPGTTLEAMAKQQGQLPEAFCWNHPYLEPKRYLPMVNHRYKTVPHYENPTLPLEVICAHLRKHHWDELAAGRKRRYRRLPLRKLAVRLGLA